MKNKSEECLDLANNIIDDFELSRGDIKSRLFKCLRLCRLLGDSKGETLFNYELSGYPQTPNGIEHIAFDTYCRMSGRIHIEIDPKDKKQKEYASTSLLHSLYAENEALKLKLSSAKDPNISISSSNPNQYITVPQGNKNERGCAVSAIKKNEELISKVEGKLYQYILNIRNVLTYSNVVVDGISSYKNLVDNKLKDICPESIKMFISSYENLNSSNSEDWANAVHSCRRILKEVSDVLYPVPNPDFIVINGKKIKLGDENYINRIVQYISNSIDNNTTKNIVSASLENIGNQIDAIYESANKGTHAKVTKEEAERFVIYTYMIIGDVLSLNFEPK